MLSKRLERHTDTLMAFFGGVFSIGVYLFTLAPDVVAADGGEFQFAAWNFGFVHPTGYPLYLILGGMFQHLVPLGTPAYRLNLFTALTAAGAVAAFYLAAHKVTRHRGAAILAAGSFAVSRAFWYDASAAEIYALNAWFVALLVYIALRWQAEPTARKIAAFSLVCGLALTHHRSIVLWIPAFILFFWVSRFKVQGSQFRVQSLLPAAFLAGCFAICGLPLLLYLYLPLRAPAAPYFVLSLAPGRDLSLYDNTPAGFINYVLGRTFQSEIGWDAVSMVRLVSFPQLLLDQFGAVGIALGIVGFAALLRRKEWAQLALLVSGFTVTILFASFYHIGDILPYYIPAYLVWALWIGIGAAALFQNPKRKTQNCQVNPKSQRTKSQNVKRELRVANFGFGAIAVVALSVLAPQFVNNYPYADRSREMQAREQWTRLLSAPIPPNAILLSNDRDEMMPLWYIQYVENTRRDLLGLFPRITPAHEYVNIGRLTDSVLDANRPVYFIKPMPGIEVKYQVEPFGEVLRVVGHAARGTRGTLPSGSSAILAGRVRVLGYAVAREPGAWRVTLDWVPLARLERNYTTFVHLLDPSGNKIAQGNDHQPGGEFYPTALWEIGDTLRDEFLVFPPANLAPGIYTLLAGMYAPPGFEPIGDPVAFGYVEIQ
jgi:hypothetical protein